VGVAGGIGRDRIHGRLAHRAGNPGGRDRVIVRALAPDGSWPQTAGGVEPIPQKDRDLHAPDAHMLAIADTATLAARCSCWWNRTPSLPAERVGVIGHFAANEAAAGVAILDAACDRLRSAGCTVAVGPMDGNTWRRYRFVTERGSEPPFFLEPDNPDGWPTQWHAAGFAPLASYTSALNTDLTRDDPRIETARARLADAGVTIRPLDIKNPDTDLRRMFTLSLESFSRNFLYTPLGEAEFLEQNRTLLPLVRPELVLLAEGGGELAGFLFAIPDVLQARRGEAIDTIIIQTVAVGDRRSRAGLGSVLVADAHATARGLGFTRAIHALMHEQNVSQNISRRYARTIRRYQLFVRRLLP
jgi:GNAT superfamily N-acetyltransferase